MASHIWKRGLAASACFAAISCGSHETTTNGAPEPGGLEEAGTHAAADAGTPSPLDGAADAGEAAVGMPSGPDGAPTTGMTTPIVLASGELGPVAIVVDASSVYWLDLGPFVGPGGKGGGNFPNGALKRCALVGCDDLPTTLASGWVEPGGLPTLPGSLALGGSTLYWAGSASVLSCPISGCTAGFATMSSSPATGVAVDAQRAYWTIYASGLVESAPLATQGGGPSSFSGLAANQAGPSAIVVDEAQVYWATYGGTVAACALAGCPQGPTVLWSGAHGSTEAATDGLAQDVDRLYWTNGNPDGTGSVFACDKSDCKGTATAIEASANSPLGIAVDDENVYWTEVGNRAVAGQVVLDVGSVRKAPKRGGAVTIVADHQVSPLGIAVDESAIYWTTMGTAAGDGQILKLPK